MNLTGKKLTYTVENTKDFVNNTTNLKFNVPVVASVDIPSLITNIPLEETTTLIKGELFNSNECSHHLNEKKQITKALQLATVDSVFTFNDNLYTQTDGVVMGSPLSLTYANALLSAQRMVKSMPWWIQTVYTVDSYIKKAALRLKILFLIWILNTLL